MKVVATNQNGQVVIPAKIRKELQISEGTPMKIIVRDGEICLQVLSFTDDNLVTPAKTRLSFPKKKDLKDFQFKSKNSSKSIIGEIDETLY